jgi:hypothetical protein
MGEGYPWLYPARETEVLSGCYSFADDADRLSELAISHNEQRSPTFVGLPCSLERFQSNDRVYGIRDVATLRLSTNIDWSTGDPSPMYGPIKSWVN